MRVIAGEFRSRVLKTLPGLDTRPTPDRLRESLFNVLSAEIAGAIFLDAYAGTGAVGIEALSRGAAKAIFIERSRAAVSVIHDNLQALRLSARAHVVHGKALAHLAQYRPDIVFLDPPYDQPREYTAALELLGGTAPSLVIAQHSRRFALAATYGRLARTRELRQGDNILTFYRPADRAMPFQSLSL
ncbi:MAG TPA: 16S rRNA (guanine(966)-N(2))-methyltransferase RsmD [Bryobacteraceae bacterium]|nr:16S rRNA (guanine(966)-N(2))-methyltransferase RsmD [Bryobacteraceae bacterium]